MKKIIIVLILLLVAVFGFIMGAMVYGGSTPYEEGVDESLLTCTPLLENELIIPTVYELPENYKTYSFENIKVTAYNNVPNQTDSTPNITASNRPVHEGIVALSRDFFKKGVRFGDLLYIDCFDSWYIVEDKMNARFTNRVDVFLFDKDLSRRINRDCSIQVISYDRE